MAADASVLGTLAFAADMIFIDKAEIAGFGIRSLFKSHDKIESVYFGQRSFANEHITFFLELHR